MRQLRCHRCGSADLVLHEARLEHGEWDGGLFVNEEGGIEARGDGYFEPGEIQPGLTRIECSACGHEWHPRRNFDGSKPVRDQLEKS
jgi:hypothetical protein